MTDDRFIIDVGDGDPRDRDVADRPTASEVADDGVTDSTPTLTPTPGYDAEPF